MCVREREGGGVHSAAQCVCVRERERERVTSQPLLCANTGSSLCLSRDCSSLRLELMVKLRTLLTVFTFILKANAGDYGKVRFRLVLVVFGQSQCSGPVGQSEQTALVRRRDLFERGGA